MIRGVSFRISQSICSSILPRILNGLDITKYSWYNIESQNEVWADSQGNVFFDDRYYDGKRFLNHICFNHYAVFLKLQAYFEYDRFYDIHTYAEFQTSDCQLLLLIYDCEFVEIYVKDQAIANTLYENAISNKFADINYITECNDGRIKMDVL